MKYPSTMSVHPLSPRAPLAKRVGCWAVTKRPLQISALFLLFFVGSSYFDPGSLESLQAASNIYWARNLPKAVIYLGAYAASIAAIVVVLFSASRTVRMVGLVVVALCFAMEGSCQMVYGYSSGAGEVQILLEAAAWADKAIAAYTLPVLLGLLKAGVALAIILAAMRWIKIRFTRKWLVTVPLSLALSYSIIWTTVAHCDTYPSPVKLPLPTAYKLLHPVYGGPRSPVELQPASMQASRPKYVLFIVDESVRGDYLGINGCPIDTTPYLCTCPNLVNFGIGCSAANSSTASNVILRVGTRLDQLPDKAQLSLRTPSSFQYAKAAGYKTYFLDGQGCGGELFSYMTAHDLVVMDEFYQAFGVNDRTEALKIGGFCAEGASV
jgi:glucan phosphoethanolaminetransferase (alkaline phosphatase superfamily)